MSDARSYGRRSTLHVDALQQQIQEGPYDLEESEPGVEKVDGGYGDLRFSYEDFNVCVRERGHHLHAVVWEHGSDTPWELMEGELDRQEVRERGVSEAYIFAGPEAEDVTEAEDSTDEEQLVDGLFDYLEGRGPEDTGRQCIYDAVDSVYLRFISDPDLE